MSGAFKFQAAKEANHLEGKKIQISLPNFACGGDRRQGKCKPIE
jgi:hypothetical protein